MSRQGATAVRNQTTDPAADRNGRFSHRQFSPERIFFGAAPVDAVTLEDAAQWLLRELLQMHTAERTVPLQVMGPNAYLVTLAAKNRSFAEALNGAALCLADGISVVWGARLLGRRVPERVPGGEFMERMCALCADHGLTLYFLGGLPGAAEGAAHALTHRYPGLRVAGTDCPPIGFEADEEQSEAVRKRIIQARPDILCVALGAPKQEIWMLDECSTLPIGAALSVGAALDTQAGLRKRAPAWTHNIGMEWLYRLVMEPRRLWRRYLIGNVEFAAVTLHTWSRQRRQHAVQDLLRPEHPHIMGDPTALDEETRMLLQIEEEQRIAPSVKPSTEN
jgi:N-acetylglucosaminyldiphosphoundecaprenol N-acetyl-beta-D-mannosaminyltransferase